jgi:hypothetical protein
MAQAIGDCPLSFPIGTGQWLQTTLEMHLAEPPRLAKPAKMEPSYCGRRGADEQIEAPDIAFSLGISRPMGWK